MYNSGDVYLWRYLYCFRYLCNFEDVCVFLGMPEHFSTISGDVHVFQVSV